MKWEKLGQVYRTTDEDVYTHAMFPVVDVLDEGTGLIRVYFTHRDSDNYGFPAFLDARLYDRSFTIVSKHNAPIIEKAALGNFDDSGVNVTSIVNDGNNKIFYYYGWNLGVTVPFRNSIGMADLKPDGIQLQRRYPGPILDRSREFPNLCATPCVLKDRGKFRMWFGSGEPWVIRNGRPNVACHVGYAESDDGIEWFRERMPAVCHGSLGDHVISAPCVTADNDVYRIWYSYRGEKYRIGYGESDDGKVFVRKDNEVGIGVSESGWDSEMVCYPHVFNLRGQRYMLYCGNDYGRTGFGLAVLLRG